MKYIVEPESNRSIRYLNQYRHKTKLRAFAEHEQYLRYESFIVEFQDDVDLSDTENWGDLNLMDESIVKSFESYECFGDEVSSDWEFFGLTFEEGEELEQYLEEEGSLDDAEDWDASKFEISIECGVTLKPLPSE